MQVVEDKKYATVFLSLLAGGARAANEIRKKNC